MLSDPILKAFFMWGNSVIPNISHSQKFVYTLKHVWRETLNKLMLAGGAIPKVDASILW